MKKKSRTEYSLPPPFRFLICVPLFALLSIDPFIYSGGHLYSHCKVTSAKVAQKRTIHQLRLLVIHTEEIV